MFLMYLVSRCRCAEKFIVDGLRIITLWAILFELIIFESLHYILN